MGFGADEESVGSDYDFNKVNAAGGRSGMFSVILLGSYFFLLFFSYSTTQNFETTLNETLGFWSLAILYFCLSLSNLFSSHVVRKFGVGVSLVMGGACYTIYIAANIFPEAYILLPCSAVIGVGAAILWNAQGVCLARCSDASTIDLNSGIFFGLFMLNLIFGNLFAAIFLSMGLETMYLFIILTVISAVATALFITIRVPPPEVLGDAIVETPSLYEVILIFKNKIFLLLVCISIYSGLSQSLYYGSFTSLIGDPITIGYVMSVFGVADCFGSISNGWIAKRLGKRFIIMLGSISVFAGCVTSNTYFIGFKSPVLLYVTALLFGYSDSAYNTQIYAIFGSYFTHNAEPYFAGFKLLQASSTAAAFFYSPYLTYPFIVLITIFFMALGLVFLFTLDRFVSPIDPHLNNARATPLN